MPQENVEVVREFFDALVDGPQAFERVAHEDVVYVEDPKWPGADTYKGRDAAIDCWSRYDELLGEEVAISVEDIRDARDEVVAIVRVRGRTRDSGVPYDHTWGYTCRTADGVVCYFRVQPRRSPRGRWALGVGRWSQEMWRLGAGRFRLK